MSEALSFAKIKLALLQSFLGALAVRDVLGRTKHFIRWAGGITLYGAHTMNSSDLAVRTNETMFNVGGNFAVKGLLSCAKDELSIFHVNHFANLRQIDGALLRIQSVDAIDFVRPNHPILDEVPRVMANIGNALSFFKPGVAFLQLARNLLQCSFRTLALSNVLNGAEQFIGSSGRVSFRVARQ